MCCGRHLSELTPFGIPGDPLVGDFSGALLIKRYRRDGPYDEEAVRARDKAEVSFEIDGYTDPLEWMLAKYGKEEGERLFWAAELCMQVGKSWECRDCAVLDEDEYFERLRERYQEEQKRQQAEQMPEESGPQ